MPMAEGVKVTENWLGSVDRRPRVAVTVYTFVLPEFDLQHEAHEYFCLFFFYPKKGHFI